MRLYISGPMTGILEANAPKFREVTERFRLMGHSIISPVELDERDGTPLGTFVTIQTWAEVLGRDIQVIVSQRFDGCILLPGWENSWGARLEVLLFLRIGVPRFLDEHGNVLFLDADVLNKFWESLNAFKLR